MNPAATGTVGEVEVLRLQARTVNQVVKLQVDGLTQEDSLIQPRPAGSCLNWVVGHLLWAYEGTLAALRQEPVMGQAALERYARGTPPLRDPAEALQLGDLITAWDEAARRVDAGLAGLTPETLSQPAPHSPNDDPDETVGSLLSVVLFHQAYHAGQTAVLRRIAGKEGAIR